MCDANWEVERSYMLGVECRFFGVSFAKLRHVLMLR